MIKLKAGRYKIPVKLTYKADRIYLSFPYSKKMIAEIKAMEGHKWHGFDEPNPKKIWSIKDSARNRFRLDFMEGKNPYERYDKEMITFETSRPLYDHQIEMVRFILTRKYCVLAGEMGLGKSLAFIEALDHIPHLYNGGIWYVGPKSGVVSVERELVKWESQYSPRMMTYERFTKVMREWDKGHAPRFICFDESSKLKNPTAQRSQAALACANAVREEWGENGYVLEMSGTPAPKAPTDWWHQAEVACPGFLREGTIGKFKHRLSLTEMRPSITGGSYPHLISWLDDDKKCQACGSPCEAPQHKRTDPLYDHPWEGAINEVAGLYLRIKDLALIQFKRDCLDLPEKQYIKTIVKPTIDTLRAARLIKKTSSRAITALTLLRELSDGFQYTQEVIGKETCSRCHGSGEVMAHVPREEVNTLDPQDVKVEDFTMQKIACDYCDANRQIDKVRRTIKEVDTPKDAALIELLDAHEDGGRFVVWGGFTGTIDRLVKLCHKYGWATLRIDGRGYIGMSAYEDVLDSTDLLDAMDASNPRRQELLDKYPRVCVVGHPKAGGMGLTFNASPTALFYSNDFDGEARMQAEDRIHRIGMDKNRGATIIDLIHLPTDQLVLDNLQKKRKLQSLTLGDLEVGGNDA